MLCRIPHMIWEEDGWKPQSYRREILFRSHHLESNSNITSGFSILSNSHKMSMKRPVNYLCYAHHLRRCIWLNKSFQSQDPIFLNHYPKVYWNLANWKIFAGKHKNNLFQMSKWYSFPHPFVLGKAYNNEISITYSITFSIAWE